MMYALLARQVSASRQTSGVPPPLMTSSIFPALSCCQRVPVVLTRVATARFSPEQHVQARVHPLRARAKGAGRAGRDQPLALRLQDDLRPGVGSPLTADPSILGITVEHQKLTFLGIRGALASETGNKDVTVPTLQVKSGEYVTDSFSIAEWVSSSILPNPARRTPRVA